jgi:hypothetical protein
MSSDLLALFEAYRLLISYRWRGPSSCPVALVNRRGRVLTRSAGKKGFFAFHSIKVLAYNQHVMEIN